VIALVAANGYSLYAKRELRRANSAPGEIVSLDTHDAHVFCQGQGSPAVFLISGMAGSYSYWSEVQQGIQSLTRVCSYDYAGLGWSTERSSIADVQDHADDLKRIIDATLGDEPHIIVGHSLGGVVGWVYAQKNREKIRGVVTLDTIPGAPHEYFGQEWFDSTNGQIKLIRTVSRLGLDAVFLRLMTGESPSPALLYLDKIPDHLEAINDPDLVEQMDSREHLGEIPVVVLEAGDQEAFDEQYSYLDEARLERLRDWWHEGQLRLADLSDDGDYMLVETAGHNIAVEEPQLVVETINDAVRRVRASQ